MRKTNQLDIKLAATSNKKLLATAAASTLSSVRNLQV